MEFNFYHVLPILLSNTITKLSEKSYISKSNVVIVVNNNSLIEDLDKLLWTYSRKIFLPHATNKDLFPELQPIYITDIIENPNQSKILILIEYNFTEINLSQLLFERIFIISSIEEEIKKNVNILLKSNINPIINIFKQQLDNSWLKA